MVFDIVALIFILIFSLAMMKKGGMKALLSLGGLILSIVVASLLYPVITNAVYSTPLPENLQEIVSETICADESASEADYFDALPQFMKKAIAPSVNSAADAVAEAVAESVTRIIINVVIFVLLVIITKVVIMFITGGANLVMKLPVLSQLNSLIGFGCGFVTSALIVWIAVALISSVGASNATAASWLEGSYVADIMSSITPF